MAMVIASKKTISSIDCHTPSLFTESREKETAPAFEVASALTTIMSQQAIILVHTSIWSL
jgi:hypothetical protein